MTRRTALEAVAVTLVGKLTEGQRTSVSLGTWKPNPNLTVEFAETETITLKWRERTVAIPLLELFEALEQKR